MTANQPHLVSRAADLVRRALAALLVVSATLAAPASAQDPAPEEDAVFAVQPSGPDGPGTRDWFSYTLDPGDVFGDTVAVSNLGDRAIRFRIYATDAEAIADTGGFAAIKDDEEPTDVGTWIELAADEYTVEPGRRIDVPFSVTVPDDAEPGDHVGAILAVDADDTIDEAGQEGVGFDVIQRIGARVYVRVNGDVAPSLRIDALDVDRDGGDATVTWEVSNTGNVRLSPTAALRITGFLGRTVETVPAVEVPELLPGANFVGGTAVGGLPGYEKLTAHLVVRAQDVEVERSTSFGSYPWLLLGLLLLALLALGRYLRRRRRLRRTGRPGPATRRGRTTERVPELV
jgi:hypothetical protein